MCLGTLAIFLCFVCFATAAILAKILRKQLVSPPKAPLVPNLFPRTLSVASLPPSEFLSSLFEKEPEQTHSVKSALTGAVIDVTHVAGAGHTSPLLPRSLRSHQRGVPAGVCEVPRL